MGRNQTPAECRKRVVAGSPRKVESRLCSVSWGLKLEKGALMSRLLRRCFLFGPALLFCVGSDYGAKPDPTSKGR
jgi:hypothetical protein